jgi:hypothetical protein
MYTRRIAFGRLRLGFFASPAAIWQFNSIQRNLITSFPLPARQDWAALCTEGRTHGDDLGTNEREGCLGQNSPKTEETPFRAGNIVILNKRTRVFPIAESETFVIGASSEVEDNSQDNQAYVVLSMRITWEGAGKIAVPVMVITLIEAKKNSASPYAPCGRGYGPLAVAPQMRYYFA